MHNYYGISHIKEADVCDFFQCRSAIDLIPSSSRLNCYCRLIHLKIIPRLLKYHIVKIVRKWCERHKIVRSQFFWYYHEPESNETTEATDTLPTWILVYKRSLYDKQHITNFRSWEAICYRFSCLCHIGHVFFQDFSFIIYTAQTEKLETKLCNFITRNCIELPLLIRSIVLSLHT